MNMKSAVTEFYRVQLEITRREWEVVGRDIHAKEREIESLRASVAELTRQHRELSAKGAKLIEQIGDN